MDATLAKQNEKWVGITFAMPVTGKVTAKERSARKRLEAAIETAMQEYHQTGDAIESVEMYPTD